MKIKSLLATILGSTLFLITACSEEEKHIVPVENKPVKFVTSVGGEEIDPLTRAAGNSWSVNDEIGIFMKKNGQNLSSGSIVNNADNVKYVTPSGNKYFTVANADDNIFLPEGQSVDFIAYYPYNENITDYKYNINIKDQSSQEKIDFLYSNNAINQNNTSSVGTIDMSFSHQLTRLIFNIKTDDYVSTLEGLQVTISGLSTRGVFDLASGQLLIDGTSVEDFSPKTTITGITAKSEAIIFPINDNNTTLVTFTLPDGKSFKHKFPTTTKFSKGTSHIYDIVLKNNGGGIKENYGHFETPVKTSIENTVFISHNLPSRNARNYSMLYDQKYRLAYWVAYPLHGYYLGSQSRTNAWGYDPKIENSYQPYLKKGFDASNTDRGHQIPSADRTYNAAENGTTFYYSNMTAQHSRLNQTIWANLENQIRTWTQRCDTMYVVTGAMITTQTDKNIEYVTDNSGKNVARPKYYYKALAQKRNENYYTIAFRMDNIDLSSSHYNSHRLTVKELEEVTGFIFFPNISEAAKNTIDTSIWN